MSSTTSTGRVLFREVVCVVLFASATATSGADSAEQILEAAAVEGGVIVHLGCADGKLTAALHADDNYLVHGLDTDAERVRQAREHVRKLGAYGRVSIELFDGKRLPYVDNMVNLVVAEDLGDVAIEEAMRVLAPGGSLYQKQAGQWTKTVKRRPDSIDEWTHFLHDASGNAVAHDDVVGPPGRVQWIAEPRHTRSHEHIPGVNALVSSAGRIFYIVDRAPVASLRQTPEWHLVARDAFNGVLLWKRSIETKLLWAWSPIKRSHGSPP